ncbi:type IV secretion system protein IcmP/DotM [Acerihabitans sp. TG2]|uniref:secretion/conjugation apparatus DotM-related subunit n=1 Tax=Acerihabitans sp. TG2 TaxID=3096008 RepID=UPI002B2311E6|nr:type IV secretion system protein IcmP/DotM [Acerihabitans sp. TG2]MEA9392135.1 type IV secretion system protein IcmP/DotM [Acerihabitans sp. TG2]
MNDANKSGGQENEAALMVIPLLGFILIIIFWMTQHYYISMVYVYIRYAELIIPATIGKFIELPPFSTAKDWVDNYCQPKGWGLIGVCSKDFNAIKFKSIELSTFVINLFLLIPIFYIAGKGFLKIQKFHPFLIFRKTHGIKSFMEEKQLEYPHLKMFVYLDLVAKDLSDPLYGMPLSSRDFVKKYGLIEGWQESKDGKTFTPTLNINKTKNVLIEQLGKLWTGNNFMELTNSEVLMLAISIPVVAATDTKLSDDEFKEIKKDSQEMIIYCWNQFIPPSKIKNKKEKINTSDSIKKSGQFLKEEEQWLNPEIDISKARDIIVKYYKRSEEVKKIFKKHAYVSTIIYGLFSEARRLGVLPAADVRWLRFYDRRMYILISNIGRPSAHPEGCAIHAHYLYEATGNVGYPEPLVNKAIDALQSQIQSFKYEAEHVSQF